MAWDYRDDRIQAIARAQKIWEETTLKRVLEKFPEQKQGVSLDKWVDLTLR